MSVALGAVDSEESESLLDHAAHCAACGERLARALHVLDASPSAEETEAIAELAAVKAEWQHKMARKLAATAARREPVLPRLKSQVGAQFGLAGFGHSPGGERRGQVRYAIAAGIAAGLLVAATAFVWQSRLRAPEHQLAMAYSQARTLELRIPGASYAGLIDRKHTRGAGLGAGEGAGNETASLLDARAGLARKLEKYPRDAHLLELQARADVLGERYDSATAVLDRLVAIGPVTAELLADAGMAYYQRGLVSGSEVDRSTALDYLRRADELTPTDPVILFNEAIVMEDRGQMMNAVEVWNRYITVERDAQWAAEGRRKLAALEQTLNKVKTHASRLRQMLATPEAMDALAGDARKLAGWDEELSSYELDSLLRVAFPLAEDGASGALSQQARGSPCTAMCRAARRLLQATGRSLEIEHHDYWLSDLLSADIETLSQSSAAIYARAVRLTGQAMREDLIGGSEAGLRLAGAAERSFQQLVAMEAAGSFRQPAGPIRPGLKQAARAGEERAAVEYLFAQQRALDFDGCVRFGQQMRARSAALVYGERYPWMHAEALITEYVCEGGGTAGHADPKLAAMALSVAQANRYAWLTARIHTMEIGEIQDSGDQERAERLGMQMLRQLYAEDAPPLRIAFTYAMLPLSEEDSTRSHSEELCLREQLGLFTVVDSPVQKAQTRMSMVRAELRIGAMREAENQLRMAYEESNPAGLRSEADRVASQVGVGVGIRSSDRNAPNFSEGEIFLASAMLESGDLEGASRHLDKASTQMQRYSDNWGLRRYAATRGQLELAQGHFDQATKTLESAIRASEGRSVEDTKTEAGDADARSEYAQQDHDLYAELAATWLAQGRSADRVLALWERFRLRALGLPVQRCPGETLDCEAPRLLAAQHALGGSILIGQIVLLDRVIVYRVDAGQVTWSRTAFARGELIRSAEALQNAVSSPATSLTTAERIGARMGEVLLPAQLVSNSVHVSDAGTQTGAEAGAKRGGEILLEPDPLLGNLAWAVLPTPAGALGLSYALAELPSILSEQVDRAERSDGREQSGWSARALVVGASVAALGEPPLPEALSEAKSVQRFMRSPEMLLGDEATTARIAQALGSATVFHFAGHAVETANGTELLLAATSSRDRSPWLDGEFLRQHPPRACRLAVLSACATGKRGTVWTDPSHDIVQTLGSLGVREVVATRWGIDSEASVHFMDAFYRSLALGASTPMALTSARRVLSKRPLYNNPYFWGAYYVSGRETIRPIGEFHASLQAAAQADSEGKEDRF